MSSVGILIPFPLKAIQTIKELDVTNVEFVWTNANNGA